MQKIVSGKVMKKALIVGGSNGIGLAIAKNMIGRDYFVEIVDRIAPDEKAEISSDSFCYHACDLTEMDNAFFSELAGDMDIDFLMITAGFGRVTNFENLSCSEIENMITVNTLAGIKIIRHFYSRIQNDRNFYCGIMGSIAGLISSPMFSVYAASKAAICRFIESVNIELEVNGSANRILNVSPGSIKGTRFNGGDNDLRITKQLAEEIVTHVLNKEELFIPEYDTVFKGVLERYRADPHAFGVSSYEYKLKSGRVRN